MVDELNSGTRCGFVALIGAPNAGKSTLINALVGSKVTIVSRKVQTTRALIRGIAVHEKSQLIFVDTPGIFSPKRRLDRAMVTTAWGGASDAELAELVRDTWSRRTDRGAELRLVSGDRSSLIPLDRLRTDPHLEMHTRGG